MGLMDGQLEEVSPQINSKQELTSTANDLETTRGVQHITVA
jgi:hypothetical protein